MSSGEHEPGDRPQEGASTRGTTASRDHEPTPGTGRPTQARADAGWTIVRDGVRVGLIMAGIGLLFVIVFAGSEVVWGTYFGADPTIGLSLSFGVMTLGVAIATGLWILREISVGASRALQQRRRTG